MPPSIHLHRGSTQGFRAGDQPLRCANDQVAGENRSGDELCDLHCVQGSTLADVVVADEQGEAASMWNTLVMADAADKARILAGSLEWGGHIRQLDAGRYPEQFACPLDRKRADEFGVDRQSSCD
jgi:hypothetical protein